MSPEPTSSSVWIPDLVTRWQWQLDTPVELSVEADVYDIDLFDNEASVVTELHARGRKVICNLSAGSWEDWRPDANLFPDLVIGEPYEDWPGERWLDIRRIDILEPIMLARIDLCKVKGFDAIEPDNIDGYANDTGFPLTYEDQLAYNRWLVEEAHRRGLSIGLKNDPDQVADLMDSFDWAITEDCFAQGWCEEMLPFVASGKAVFAAEYTDTGATTDQFCPYFDAMNINGILKHRDLGVYRESCR